MRPIYVDDTATTPIDPAVFAAMEPYVRAAFGNPSRAHAYGAAVRHVVTERVWRFCRASIASSF